MALQMLITTTITTTFELQSWKGPYGSLSPAPVKEAQWGVEFPPSGFLARSPSHTAIQQLQLLSPLTIGYAG